MALQKPIGTITRGTTNPNRLRRVDRWITRWPGLNSDENPLVVDLGFGAKAITTFELAERVSKTHGGLHVLGIEIDPERVGAAERELRTWKQAAATAPIASLIEFQTGGFEVPTSDYQLATVIRAFNVLRQYEEAQVAPAWKQMQSRLTEKGVLIDGTCDELGRVCSWIAVTPSGPQTLTLSLRLNGLASPSLVAERLPKSLIHHNVAGEAIHTFLTALDEQWLHNAGLSTFGVQQRWIRSVTNLKAAGWPIRDTAARWRLGELTLDYGAVAP